MSDEASAYLWRTIEDIFGVLRKQIDDEHKVVNEEDMQELRMRMERILMSGSSIPSTSLSARRSAVQSGSSDEWSSSEDSGEGSQRRQAHLSSLKRKRAETSEKYTLDEDRIILKAHSRMIKDGADREATAKKVGISLNRSTATILKKFATLDPPHSKAPSKKLPKSSQRRRDYSSEERSDDSGSEYGGERSAAKPQSSERFHQHYTAEESKVLEAAFKKSQEPGADQDKIITAVALKLGRTHRAIQERFRDLSRTAGRSASPLRRHAAASGGRSGSSSTSSGSLGGSAGAATDKGQKRYTPEEEARIKAVYRRMVETNAPQKLMVQRLAANLGRSEAAIESKFFALRKADGTVKNNRMGKKNGKGSSRGGQDEESSESASAVETDSGSGSDSGGNSEDDEEGSQSEGAEEGPRKRRRTVGAARRGEPYTPEELDMIYDAYVHARKTGQVLAHVSERLAQRLGRSDQAIKMQFEHVRVRLRAEAEDRGGSSSGAGAGDRSRRSEKQHLRDLVEEACAEPGNIAAGHLKPGVCRTLGDRTHTSDHKVQELAERYLRRSDYGMDEWEVVSERVSSASEGSGDEH